MHKLSLAGVLFTVAACLLTGAPEEAFAKEKQDLVIFGDSLSDTGNRFFVTGMKNTPPYDLLAQENLRPSNPYAIGGATYTNGTAWIEYFARAVSHGGASQAVAQSNGAASNYAYAGARASNEFPLPDNGNENLIDQMGDFLAEVNGGVSPDPLYVIFIGGNDIAEAVGARLQGQSEAVADWIIGNAVASVEYNVLDRLYDAGARRFLFLTAPNSGYVPLFGGVGGGLGFQLATDYNTGVQTLVIDELVDRGAEVHILDVFALFEQLINQPEDFGIANTSSPCVMPFVPPFRCERPDSYAYWDNLHPTAAVHEIIGEAAISLMSP